MKKYLIKSVAIAVLMVICVLYGVMIQREHIFPYVQMQKVYQAMQRGNQPEDMVINDSPQDEPPESAAELDSQSNLEAEKTPSQRVLSDKEKAMFEEIDPLFYQTDVASLITLYNAEDVTARREELIRFLWGADGFPGNLPSEVERGVTDQPVQGLTHVERVDRLVIEMHDYDLDSIVYHFIPAQGNGKLIIWHEGHLQALEPEYIQFFIDQGYAVLAFCMPFYCENTRPIISLPRFGDIYFDTHHYMYLLDPQEGHTIKYFIEPVVVGLNYILGEYDYHHIAMAGYSGGGWSTTMAAAIDPRIQSSFPTAGSYPFFLLEKRDTGHYEHLVPELYTLANFLELYVMGGYGEGRRQIQITNQYDPCCYAGIKGQLYMEHVSKRVEELGAGSWELFIDPYDHHGLSAQALQLIIDTLSGK